MTRMPKRILMVYSSVLLKEIINKAVAQHDGLTVIEETEGLEEVSEKIQLNNPDWVLIIHKQGISLPENIIKRINQSQQTKVITFAIDGSKLMLFEPHSSPKPLFINKLDQLIDIMAGENSTPVYSK